MLKLTNITKDYVTGDTKVKALKGVSVEFRKNEFVSILGHSGCGKTTLLNIIGGLDKYTDGDLSINGTSTKEFEDLDWDSYRNHSIGFVFQSYNLIPHQTVLSNVELALTLSGVSKAERKKRAQEALRKVGLEDQLNKKPNQMSGGQMQRVAIARALVNDPDILLADEPTGALDTETSKQIMEILKEVAEEKLVIMVTHNPEIANEYSNRIIRLVDGEIISDTNPYVSETQVADTENSSQTKSNKKAKKKAAKKHSMSLLTALSLSFNNLLTKKTRTILTSFAGSIGIIGIALILALSNGIQAYIDRVQEETLSSYPIVIEAESVDMTAMLETLMGINSENYEHDLDAVYSSPVLGEMINSMTNATVSKNNLKPFMDYLESGDKELDDSISAIDYSYNFDFNVFFKDEQGNIIKSDAIKLMQESMGISMDSAGISGMQMGMSEIPIYEKLLEGRDGKMVHDLLTEQYDVIHGHWPEAYNEVVLVVNENNEVSDFALLALGLTTLDEAKETWNKIEEGEEINTQLKKWSYEDICNMSFRFVPTCNLYNYDSKTGTYIDVSSNQMFLSAIYNEGIELKISGIIRPNPDNTSSMLNGVIGYTHELSDKIIEMTNNSKIVKAQKENPDIDVFTGLPFKTDDYQEPDAKQKAEAFNEYISSLSTTQKAELYKAIMSTPDDLYIAATVEQQMATLNRETIVAMIEQIDDSQTDDGFDKETQLSMIADMTDEQLLSMAEQMLPEVIKEQYAAQVQAQLANVPENSLAMMLDGYMMELGSYTEENATDYVKLYDNHMPATVSSSSFEQNLSALGAVAKDSPSTISIYASTFEAKDKIATAIEEYNSKVSDDDKITYTDYVALMMSSISTIIDVISYVLIAFVAISLIVSSIMIGIITYISVLERTKEIGVLRAIGASKKDVSRVFNAETLIVGFVAGAIGIGATLILTVPINIIIRSLSGIETIGAELPVIAAILLVIISMGLTFISGLIPSGIAAKKDPVEALRSE